jgi:predicted anti-sigma-YlaC factor YlaD
MNAMTCEAVQAQLDLLAAGACDPPLREALEQHLHQCPACAARFAESRRLLGLLDLHWSEAGVERLRQRIDQEARPRRARRPFAPFVRGAVAAAAVFLIAVGMIWWLPPWDPNGRASEPQFALLVHAGKEALKIDQQRPVRAPGPAPVEDKGVEAGLALAAPAGAALRRELLKAQREGKLPPPPAVALELALVNDGKRPVEVRLGDVVPTLELELQGDGVLRLPADQAPAPEFLQPRSLQLEPGQRHVIHVDRLVAGSRGQVEYIYLTEPGEYTLTARLRLTAGGQVVTVTGTPVRIKVGN